MGHVGFSVTTQVSTMSYLSQLHVYILQHVFNIAWHILKLNANSVIWDLQLVFYSQNTFTIYF